MKALWISAVILSILITCFAVAAMIFVRVSNGAPACYVRDSGVFPDPICTPGVTNPKVTQATIHQTICVRGWTSTIRPPENVTEPEKLSSMAQYGDTTGPSNYEYDHFIPLELGGAPNSLKNFWPEPHDVVLNGHNYGSFTKDDVENELRYQVCKGNLTLAQAQQIITSNWTQGLKYVYGGATPPLTYTAKRKEK